jgi:sulfate transport system ATP-binding protein
MSISIRNVTKSFGATPVLDKVSLEVPGGSLLALLGPSGSGKTTLLRIIAGLETADAGSIHYDDGAGGHRDVTNVPARERNVGFVFQHYALFRHMTVFDNVAFGLQVRRAPKDETRARVLDLLKMVRLEGYDKRYPNELSGGQRQRVALARALAIRPGVLLLDEPFGALDAKVRLELRQWIRKLHDEIHVTTVFVTHDQEEAFEVADQVVVMSKGHIEQSGPPQEVFDRPATPFVMDFLGNVNVFHGRVENGKLVVGGMELAYSGSQGEGSTATGYIRPHELEIHREAASEKSLKARVTQVNAAGSVAKIRVAVEEYGVLLSIDLSPDRFGELQLRRGDEVYVTPKQMRVFSADDYAI